MRSDHPRGEHPDQGGVGRGTKLAAAGSEDALEELPGASSRQQHVLRTLMSRAAKPKARDELAYAVAEIERASKALQAAEPRSVRFLPGLRDGTHARHCRSIWLMVAIIWISSAVLLVIGSAAILYLLR
jgi:hypothetical protein